MNAPTMLMNEWVTGGQRRSIHRALRASDPDFAGLDRGDGVAGPASEGDEA